MESQPQNPEFRNNPENFHPWKSTHMLAHLVVTYSFCSFSFFLSSTWSSLEQRDIIIRFYHIHLQKNKFSHLHPKWTQILPLSQEDDKGVHALWGFFPPYEAKILNCFSPICSY